MQKRRVQVGDEFGKLEVIEYAASDVHGNQRVVVRCSCQDQTEKTVRLTGLTFEPYTDKNGKLRLPYRSCGCESKRAHREYWELRARGFRIKTRKRIWRAHQDGITFKELADSLGLPVGVISAICRVYQAKHPGYEGGAIPKGSKAYGEWMRKIEGDLPY